MSESVCAVAICGIVAVVALVLGVVALVFGRGMHLKGSGLEVKVTEPKPPQDGKPPQARRGKKKPDDRE